MDIRVIKMKDYVTHRLYWKSIWEACELVSLDPHDLRVAESVAEYCLLKRQDEWVISWDECWSILHNEIKLNEKVLA